MKNKKTSDNAIVVFWLDHVLYLGYRPIYLRLTLYGNKCSKCQFFLWNLNSLTKKNGWEKTNSMSCLQKNIRNYEQCRPSNNEKDIKLTKLQNFKYEQLDFTRLWRLCNSNNFYLLMLLNGLQVLVAPNVWNR